MTPSFIGLMTFTSSGFFPNITLACCPIAIILLLSLDTATTDGSLMTTPAFFLYTNVLAVPKSIAISFAFIPSIPQNDI